MTTILLIILLIVLLGGGGGYYAHGRYGASGLGGVLGLVLVVLIVLWLVGAFEHRRPRSHLRKHFSSRSAGAAGLRAVRKTPVLNLEHVRKGRL